MASPASLVHQLHAHAASTPDEPALFDKIDGRWDALTWSGYLEAAREVAAGLLDLGVEPGQTVVLMGPNRRDWALAQLGTWMMGGLVCPIYATSTDEQAQYIAEHAEAVVAFGGDAASMTKLDAIRGERLATLVAMSGAGGGALSIDALRARGRSRGFAEVDARLDAIDRDTLALLIYTSGTTGKPKGVMLDHGNMLAVSEGVYEANPELQGLEDGYVLLSYLPLSHVAEQMFTFMSHMQVGGQVYFCPELEQLKDYLAEVRPTIFVAVPRVWEKFQAALEARLSSATGLKKHLAQWALATEKRAALADIGKGTRSESMMRGLARKLVVDKIKQALGLDRVAMTASGAAPIANHTLEFFASLGIIIQEGFGMTETAGAISSNPARSPRFGSVGQAIPGVEMTIGSDGEILLRGRAMTRGYFKQPEATAELVDEQGWLHTGDLGRIDEQGFLRITGRKKEILITAGGKNVAPVEIEARLNAIPGVAQSVVLGDRAPYLVALLVLDHEALPELNESLGLGSTSPADVAGDPKLLAHLQAGVDEVNAGLARYQTVKRFEVLYEEFSVEGGELTPTMKLKRPVIARKYDDRVKALYDGGRPEAASA